MKSLILTAILTPVFFLLLGVIALVGFMVGPLFDEDDTDDSDKR